MTSQIPCANCDNTCPGRGPFCGSYCKAYAEFVRLCRRWLRDAAKRADPNYPYVLRLRLAFLNGAYLGHGEVYNEATRYLTAAQKTAIRDRDRGLCVQCGRPGVEIDHVEGPSDDPSNLQLLCRDCHHAKTDQSMTMITDPAELEALRTMHEELSHRIDGITPVRACDNEQTWSKAWRSWPAIPAQHAVYDEPVTNLRFADLMRFVESVEL